MCHKVDAAIKTLIKVHDYIAELDDPTNVVSNEALNEVRGAEYGTFKKMDPTGKGHVTQDMWLEYFQKERKTLDHQVERFFLCLERRIS